MRTISVPGRLPLLLLTLLVTACDHENRERLGGPSGPSGPSGPTAGSLDVTAPSTIAPGASVRLRAVLQMSDGSSRDVTDQAIWSTTTPEVLRLQSGGTVSGVSLGDGLVRVAAQSIVKDVPIMVLPDGTFRLTGKVSDATDGFALSGVAVSARTLDDGVVHSATTDRTGSYRLYGVRGETVVTFSRNLFETLEVRRNIQSHQSIDAEVRLSVSIVDMRGLFDFRIQADASCTDILPGSVLSRPYIAQITQQINYLLVTVREAAFVPNANEFDGSVEGNQIRFWLWQNAYADAPWPSLSEQVSTTLVFTPVGIATLATTAEGAAGHLDGRLMVTDSSVSPPRTLSCEGRHAMTLTRK